MNSISVIKSGTESYNIVDVDARSSLSRINEEINLINSKIDNINTQDYIQNPEQALKNYIDTQFRLFVKTDDPLIPKDVGKLWIEDYTIQKSNK